MKTILSLLAVLLISNLAISQTTAIPDSTFEQKLIYQGYDSGTVDGVVLTANINSIDSLNLGGMPSGNISDLTGLQDFVSLTWLNISSFNIDSVDLSQNTQLKTLYCHYNNLTSIDLSQNTALEFLTINNNALDSIDVSMLPSLEEFGVGQNQLTSLDVTQNTLLTSLNFTNNQLTSIDLSQNVMLNYLQCSLNSLSSLDVSLNTALLSLTCHNNQLTSLDLTQNTNLTFLNCTDNQLTDLLLSQHPLLDEVWCRYNQLTSLDISGLPILDELICASNPITNLDVTQNLLLTKLYCQNNLLTSLDLAQNVVLTDLYCSGNPLTSLDLSQNTALVKLDCQDNPITGLNLSQNPALNYLNCYDNDLYCLNIKNGNNVNLSTLYATNNPNLNCIEVDDSTWAVNNWTSNVNYSFGVTFNTNCNNSCSGIPCTTSADFSVVNNGNGNYSFTNNSSGSFTQSHWAFGDGTTSSLSNLNHTFSANGTFVVILTINDSATNCFDYFVDTISVTGVTNPLQCASGFVIYPEPLTGDITVINSSTGTNLNYLWDFGDGNTSTLQNPSHTYATAGPFYLCLSIDDGAGCVDMHCDSIGANGVVFKTGGFTINVSGTPIITGVEDIELNRELIIYPNPTSNQLSIDTDIYIDGISISDVTGKQIKSFIPNSNTINVEDLSDGIYFIKIEGKDQSIIRKFIKQ